MYNGFYEHFKILVDTREQKNQHLLNFWAANNIKIEIKKLDIADYSFKLDKINFEYDIVIERKASIDELCANLTKYRDRFKREFKRAEDKRTFIILLIENSLPSDIERHNYRSQMHPNALKGSLKSLKDNYNVYIQFCDKNYTGEFILNAFKRYIKKYVLSEIIEKGLIDLTEKI